jgi:DNA polymerase
MTNTLQYCGAQRTGRWAGRGLQLQNLKRSPKDMVEQAEQLVESPETYADSHTLEDLGGLVRAAITASEGHTLVVSDLAAIESRVLGWLTGCAWINQTFFEGRDTYKAFAEMWLRVPYDQVDKATRTLAKPPFLGFGYGIGAVGLKKYAEGMGVPMDEEQCASAIRTARRVCHEVPTFWGHVEAAFRSVTQTGESVTVGPARITLAREGRFLTIQLPSGRKLYYDDPKIDLEDGSLGFMGQNQYTNKWERITTWGGKLTENLCQAIARDILAFGMLLYTQRGGTIIGHVHDEVIAEEKTQWADSALAYLNYCLSVTPPWAPGLILGSEGFLARRYCKA